MLTRQQFKSRKLVKRLLQAVGIFWLLLVLLSFIIRIHAVQNFTADQVAKYLSRTLHAKVQVEDVRLSIIDQLHIKGILVEDQAGDTLLYASSIRAKLTSGWFSIISKRMAVKSITLSDAKFNLRRDSSYYYNNLEQLIQQWEGVSKLDSMNQPSADLNFDLDIKTITLKRITFTQEDQSTGLKLNAFLEKGQFLLHKLDLPKRLAHIEKVVLDRPSFKVEQSTGIPYPITLDSILSNYKPPSDTSFWSLYIDHFLLDRGEFAFKNTKSDTLAALPDSILSYKDLVLSKIDMSARNFQLRGNTYQGKLEHIEFKEKSGFELQNCLVQNFEITPQRIALFGLNFKTPDTAIGDTLIFKYNQFSDFSDFTNRVKLDLALNNSTVQLKDVMTFAPSLQKDRFFLRNKDKKLRISGRLLGTINDLSGKNLKIQLNGKTLIEGSFSSNNLTVPDEQTLLLNLSNLQTNVSVLRKIIPNFSLPSNFDRLGNIRFNGNFNYLFEKLIIDGTLRTQLGAAELDMGFTGLDNPATTQYYGDLNLENFNLGKWMNNDDFGKISAISKVTEGKGLTEKSADALLSIDLQSMYYKNYNYQNAKFNGHLNKQLFEGRLSIEDDHIQFDFLGTVDYKTKVPKFDFELDLRLLQLKALNLSNQDISLSGKMDMDMSLMEKDLSLSEGTAVFRQITIQKTPDIASIDSISIKSRLDTDNQRHIILESEIAKITLDGAFSLGKLSNALMSFANQHYPSYAKKFKLKQPQTTLDSQQFELKVEIKNTGNLTKILDPKLDTLKDVLLEASFESNSSALNIDLETVSVRYDSINFYGLSFNTDLDSIEGSLDVGLDSILLKDKSRIESSRLIAYVYDEEVKYGFDYARGNTNEFYYALSIDGVLSPLDSVRFQTSIGANTLKLLAENWQVSPDNYIRFGDGNIEVNNFILTDLEKRVITLNKAGQNGIKLGLQNFSFGLIDSFWRYEPLDFKGKFSLNLEVQDLYKLNDLSASLRSDSLIINEDAPRQINLNIFAENLKSTINSRIEISNPQSLVNVDAKYNPPAYKAVGVASKQQEANYFDINLKATAFPLDFIENFIVGASEFKGTVNTDLKINGKPNLPNINGELIVNNASFKVDFLNTRYFLNQQKATINNRWIDASKAIVKDEAGGIAKLRGGITHRNLKDFGLSLDIIAETPFIALNTTKADNDIFYGKGVGTGNITFTGSFSQTNIQVKATTQSGTRIIIPVSSTQDAEQVNFIQFPNKDDVKRDTFGQYLSEIRGVDLDLNLTLTDVAQIDLVFDERSGDILSGRGRGDIQIYLDRTGELAMYGNYFIEQGEYLFTLFNLVNKPFIVQRGGRLRWRGDPFNAAIDINAKYKDLSASVANLIPEFLSYAPQNVQDRAKQPTDIDLTMKLQGELFNPSITFDLGFPRLQGDIKTYVDNKMLNVEQDQNELNKQVFGLIVLGQFIPSEFTLSGQSGSDIAISTVSELVANQLSILVTDFFLELIQDAKVISSIDFDLAYNRFDNTFDVTQDNLYIYGEEFELRQKASLWNDKIILILGGNVTNTANQNDTKTFFGNDIVVEGVLNKDRSLKLRVYQIRQPSIIEGADVEYGVGLSYRKEFNSFKDFFGGIFKKQK